MRRAGLRARLVAAGIDLIIAWAVAVVVNLAVMPLYAGIAVGDAIWPWTLLILTPPAAYMATELVGGRTVGKAVMKLRILRDDRRPAGRTRLAVRLLLKLSPLVLPVLLPLALAATALYGPVPLSHLARGAFDLMDLPSILVLIMAGSPVLAVLLDLLPVTSPARQAVHDRLCGTAVFEPGDEPNSRGAFEVITQPL